MPTAGKTAGAITRDLLFALLRGRLANFFDCIGLQAHSSGPNSAFGNVVTNFGPLGQPNASAQQLRVVFWHWQ